MYPYPLLYNIGSIKIYTYGFFIALGILISTILAARKDKKVSTKLILRRRKK